ncbi:MAG: hypothetical protein ABJG41_01460 [Cyclobacteriaceae bacterium]
MKTSTAIKKLKPGSASTTTYSRELYHRPENIDKIVKLRKYAKNLILKKNIDPRPFRRIFFTEEYKKLLQKMNHTS